MANNLKSADLDQISINQLKYLLKHGKVKLVIREPLALTKTELPEYQQFNQLIGVSISISQASRKYKISTKTISRWVKNGYIRKLGMHMNRVLIDEADMAYCHLVFKENPGQGKHVFNPDGTPYFPKH